MKQLKFRILDNFFGKIWTTKDSINSLENSILNKVTRFKSSILSKTKLLIFKKFDFTNFKRYWRKLNPKSNNNNVGNFGKDMLINDYIKWSIKVKSTENKLIIKWLQW